MANAVTFHCVCRQQNASGTAGKNNKRLMLQKRFDDLMLGRLVMTMLNKLPSGMWTWCDRRSGRVTGVPLRTFIAVTPRFSGHRYLSRFN